MKINACFHLHLPAIRRLAVTLLTAWIVMLTVFVLVMVGVHTIPREAIEANGRVSMQQLENRKQTFTLAQVGNIFRLDTYTDELLMNMALSADTSDPLRAAVLNNYYQTADGDLILYFPGGVAVPPEQDMTYYGRYWHGHQVFVRPALVFATYNGIALFNICFSVLLFCVVLVLIYRRLGLGVAALYGMFILLSYFPVSAACFQYIASFVLAFLGTMAVLMIKPLSRSFIWCVTGFFVLGAFIAFFDLLSFPLITLCYPGAVLCLAAARQDRLKLAVGAVAGWAMGYAVFIVTKWLVGWIVMDWGFVCTAILCASVRFGEMECVSANLLAVYIMICISFMILLGLVLCHFRRCRLEALLVFASLPVIWFLVLRNHSGWHFYFTWRILVASAFCLAVFYLTLIRQKKEHITHDSGADTIV